MPAMGDTPRKINFAKDNRKMIFGMNFKSVCGYLFIKNPRRRIKLYEKWVLAKTQTIKGE